MAQENGALVVASAGELAAAARSQMDRIKHHWQRFWFELADFHKHERWTALGYSSFKKCVETELEMSEQRAYQILDAAKVAAELRTQPRLSTEFPDINERQARELAPLKKEPEQMAAAWEEAVETAPEGKVTASHVADVVQRYTASEWMAEAARYDEPGPTVEIRSEALARAERAGPLLERVTRRLQRHPADAFALRDRLELDRLMETVVRCLGRADQLRPTVGEALPAPDLAALNPRQRGVLRELEGAPGGLTQYEIQERTGLDEKAAWAVLQQLRERRVVGTAAEKRGRALVYVLAHTVVHT